MPATETVIEAEIANHQYAKADADLRAVIEAKPQSAKAHYWLAQVLGYEGRAQDALAELQRAKSIDPSLSFTNADAFHRVETSLQASAGHAPVTHSGGLGSNLGPTLPATATTHTATVSTPVAPPAKRVDNGDGGVSGTQIVVVIALIVGAIWFFRRRQGNAGAYPSFPVNGGGAPGVPPGSPPGYGGFGYPPAAPPAGGGLGSVVAGAAGGFILGEMLGHSRDAQGTTVIHDVVHDAPPVADSGSNYGSDFDPGNDDGGSFGGDSGGFDSGSGGGDF